MPFIKCPNCGRRVRVEERQFGRVLKCPNCSGRFLADHTLPADIEVVTYAQGDAPPVQRPPAGELPEPPPPTERLPRDQLPPEPIAREPATVNPLAVIAILLGFLSIAVACIPRFGYAAGAAGLDFGIVGSHREPRGFALAGMVLSAVGIGESLLFEFDYLTFARQLRQSLSGL
jgi:Transcription factor zinc-finger